MKPLTEIRSAKEKKEQALLEISGVTGVDIGPKIVDGKETDELVVRVYVEKKKDLSEVPPGERIPKTTYGVKTDVIERTFELHQLRVRAADLEVQVDTATYEPLRGGISIGPCRLIDGYVYVGTLGAIVTDRSSGEPLLLSNFHVLCVDESWTAGDTIAQPGRVDGGTCPAGVVGALERGVLAGTTAGGEGAGVDCAVARQIARGYLCDVVEIGQVRGTAAATLGTAVRKRGRTTGLTHGTVDSIDLTVKVPYGDGLGDFILKRQLAIVPDTKQSAIFGQGGDSGSVVVDDQNRVVGLYFAGATDGSMGVANPIQAVLDALDVSICVAPTGLETMGPTELEAIPEYGTQAARGVAQAATLEERVSRLEGAMAQLAGPLGPGPRASLQERVARLEAAMGQMRRSVLPEDRPAPGKRASGGEPAP